MATMAGCGYRSVHSSFQISTGSNYGDSGCSSPSYRLLRRIAGHKRVTGGNVAARTWTWKVLASGRSTGSGRDGKEPKLDDEDMMTLQFGRLLGESRETTLSKILRRKTDPDATFLDTEDALEKGAPARPLVKPRASVEPDEFQRSLNTTMSPRVPKSEDTLPDLLSRPARPQGTRETVGPSTRVMRPQGKKAKVEDYDYSQLIRKPVVGSAMNAPQFSPVEVIPPMTMRRAKQNVAAVKPLQDSSLLRKPSFGAVDQTITESSTSGGNATGSVSSSLGEPIATSAQSSLRSVRPQPPKPAAPLLPKPADGFVPGPQLVGTNSDLLGGSLGSSARALSEAVDEEIVAEVEQRDASAEETVVTDGYAGWSDEVRRALLKSEDVDKQGQAADDAANRRSTERKQGLLRRPAAPQFVEPPMQSAKQQLQETRPYVPKPLPVVIPNMKPLERPGDTLQILSKKIMSGPDEELTADDTNDSYWAQAEALHESLTVIEVEIVRVTGDGVLAAFGPLLAYLPAWELGSDRDVPSFSSWAQARGVDVIQKKAGTGILAQPREDRDQAMSMKVKKAQGDSSDLELAIPTAEERQNLLDAYKKERETQLTALIGKKATVVVTAVDKSRQKLSISERRSEGAAFELAQKKASLIASLKIGDVVTCLVRRVNAIGAFVELGGVPALIHSSELSWNRVTDPTTVLTPEQEVKVKVSRLDRHLQRISLSLRQMQADPLQETLESLVSSKDMAARSAEQPETELLELVELKPVLERLLKTDGVYGAVKGRRFRGAALATSFQIYLSEPLSDGYKLLARSGNEVQEILVQTSLSKEEVKKVILNCVVEGDEETQQV